MTRIMKCLLDKGRGCGQGYVFHEKGMFSSKTWTLERPFWGMIYNLEFYTQQNYQLKCEESLQERACSDRKDSKKLEFLLWLSGLRLLRTWVQCQAPPSGSRIKHCPSCGGGHRCGSNLVSLWLQTSIYGSDLTPSLGNSICCRCSCKQKKTNTPKFTSCVFFSRKLVEDLPQQNQGVNQQRRQYANNCVVLRQARAAPRRVLEGQVRNSAFIIMTQ